MTRRSQIAAGAAVALGARTALRLATATQLAGKVVLITGGSRGLGFALARELARHGARLAICARGGDALERARTKLAAEGADVLATRCDVSDRTQVEAWVAEATERYGRVDVLVNNAGIITVGPLRSLVLEDYEEAMAIMFWGVVYPTYAVLPGMLERGEGTIVNVTSIGGKISVPQLLAYNPSKYAAVGFSQGLRAELAREGIRVVTVVPGLMRTGSYLRAEFGGDREGEYHWFALGASAPYPVAVGADRAARSIVRAVKRGKAEHTFPITAALAARLNGLLPAATAHALGLVDRLLPGADSAATGSASGLAVEATLDAPLLDVATTLGRAAAETYRQYPGPEARTRAD